MRDPKKLIDLEKSNKNPKKNEVLLLESVHQKSKETIFITSMMVIGKVEFNNFLQVLLY